METRDCLIMETDYGMVAILPVGMSQVCSCNFEENLEVGMHMEKGDPMGYFLFGGSDIVMIFEEGVEVTLDNTGHVLMGENYASLTKNE